MNRIIRAEWRKLRRPTLLLGTLGAAAFFSALFSALLFLLIDSPDGNSDRGRMVTREMLATAHGVTQGFASVGSLLGIIALCVFAAQTAQEYTYGTLRNLLVREPGRLRLLAGKLISMKLFALAMVIVSAISSITAQVICAPGAEVSTSLWFGPEGRSAIAHSFLNVLISVIYFGIIGMTLGLLLRSPITAISIGVLWILILENLLMAVKANLQRWLPGNILSTVAQGGTEFVTYSRALTLGSIYVLAAAIVATVFFARRDVAN